MRVPGCQTRLKCRRHLTYYPKIHEMEIPHDCCVPELSRRLRGNDNLKEHMRTQMKRGDRKLYVGSLMSGLCFSIQSFFASRSNGSIKMQFHHYRPRVSKYVKEFTKSSPDCLGGCISSFSGANMETLTKLPAIGKDSYRNLDYECFR